MDYCLDCGAMLSQEMIECGYCFECGADLKQQQEKEQQQQAKERQQQLALVEQRKIADSKAWEERVKSANNSNYYEYKAVTVRDLKRGGTDIETLNQTLNELGREGWRLVTSFTNELGKNNTAINVAGTAFGINTTMDEVVLIFERAFQL